MHSNSQATATCKLQQQSRPCCVKTELINSTLYPCSLPWTEGEDTGSQCTSASVPFWTMTWTLSGADKGTAKQRHQHVNNCFSQNCKEALSCNPLIRHYTSERSHNAGAWCLWRSTPTLCNTCTSSPAPLPLCTKAPALFFFYEICSPAAMSPIHQLGSDMWIIFVFSYYLFIYFLSIYEWIRDFSYKFNSSS